MYLLMLFKGKLVATVEIYFKNSFFFCREALGKVIRSGKELSFDGFISFLKEVRFLLNNYMLVVFVVANGDDAGDDDDNGDDSDDDGSDGDGDGGDGDDNGGDDNGDGSDDDGDDGSDGEHYDNGDDNDRDGDEDDGSNGDHDGGDYGGDHDDDDDDHDDDGDDYVTEEDVENRDHCLEDQLIPIQFQCVRHVLDMC